MSEEVFVIGIDWNRLVAYGTVSRLVAHRSTIMQL